MRRAVAETKTKGGLLLPESAVEYLLVVPHTYSLGQCSNGGCAGDRKDINSRRLSATRRTRQIVFRPANKRDVSFLLQDEQGRGPFDRQKKEKALKNFVGGLAHLEIAHFFLAPMPQVHKFFSFYRESSPPISLFDFANFKSKKRNQYGKGLRTGACTTMYSDVYHDDLMEGLQ